MIKEKLHNKNPKPIDRCTACDRETDAYYAFLSPTNEIRVVCWECQMVKEKGFNAKRGFKRRSRRGIIPR